MTRNIWIGIVVVVVLVAGGWWYLNQSGAPATSEATQQNTTSGVQPVVNSQPSQSAQTASEPTNTSHPGWVITKNEQLGIQFERPVEWYVSPVEKRTIDGVAISVLATYPKEDRDPTLVYFFSSEAAFEEVKNIDLLSINTDKTEFREVTLGNLGATRRIDHFTNNDCTNELTFIVQSGVTYGSGIVQCPTHPAGYDQLRGDVANSLKLI